MCHSELGPGTEYGRLLARFPLHLKALLKGSDCRRACLTLSLVTWRPSNLRHPHTIVSPTSGCSFRMLYTTDNNSSLDMHASGLNKRPNSTRLWYRVILETPRNCVRMDQWGDSQDNCWHWKLYPLPNNEWYLWLRLSIPETCESYSSMPTPIECNVLINVSKSK